MCVSSVGDNTGRETGDQITDLLKWYFCATKFCSHLLNLKMLQDFLGRILLLFWFVLTMDHINVTQSSTGFLNENDTDIISSWDSKLLLQQTLTIDGSGAMGRGLCEGFFSRRIKYDYSGDVSTDTTPSNSLAVTETSREYCKKKRKSYNE